MEIKRTINQGHYGETCVLSVKVGEITLSMNCNPPWKEIEEQAKAREAEDKAQGITHRGQTISYWWHRGRLVKEFEKAREAKLLEAAEKLASD